MRQAGFLPFSAVIFILLSGVVVRGQTVCAPVAVYSPCEIAFELDAEEVKAHPDVYLSVEMHIEFRSPHHRTLLLPAFWDGGNQIVVRFAPTEAGEWEYRITSNLVRFDGKEGKVMAIESKSPGFVRPANVHHWAYTEGNKAHLWMTDTNYEIAVLPKEAFIRAADARSAQKFTHLRGLALGPETGVKAFDGPDQPSLAFFRELDRRVAYLNNKGLTFDLILFTGGERFSKMFPTRQQRERFVRYMVARYSAFNVTWEAFLSFEDGNSRGLADEVGLSLKKMDPYQHPRSSGAHVTSSPLAGDGWMTHIVSETAEDPVGAIEHQIYALPAVNVGFAYEDSGAGKSLPDQVDTDTFRHRLWSTWMNGQYPGFANTGTYGGSQSPFDAKYLDSAGAKQMSYWFDFASDTRHWELEPYFDVDGGRCLALEGIEYILYVEKPGPVEVRVEKHGYDVQWFNPATGEFIKLKNYKGEKFAAEPPDRQHDWVLYLSREGKKESMLNSYKFESRPLLTQEVEQDVRRIPYDIAEPAGDEVSYSHPPKFSVKIKRETRGTRSMMYLWTADLVSGSAGARVIGTGANGTFRFPPEFGTGLPAVLNVHLTGMNANGKVYALDRVYTLNP